MYSKFVPIIIATHFLFSLLTLWLFSFVPKAVRVIIDTYFYVSIKTLDPQMRESMWYLLCWGCLNLFNWSKFVCFHFYTNNVALFDFTIENFHIDYFLYPYSC